MKNLARASAISIALFITLWLLTAQSQPDTANVLSRWRPNQASAIRFVGNEACAECHKDEAETYASSPMARALELPGGCEVLRKNPRLTFREGPYDYEITSFANRSVYSVTDGKKKISEPILYCFGRGVAGQTYIFRHNGTIYESRVSYYTAINGLDFTIGQSRVVPISVEAAIGRPLSEGEAVTCFGCHTTGAVAGSRLQLDRLAAGVRCEACHGPGEKHIETVRTQKLANLQIFNPSVLSGYELNQEFCGTCHMSFDQTMLLPGQGGMNNIRFQAYRIFNSKGHNQVDWRVSCVACHNPHKKVQHEPEAYDNKCTACHLSTTKEKKTTERSAAPCPVSTRGCVSCHMPKVALPGTHAKFTDHWIRIARPGAPTPH